MSGAKPSIFESGAHQMWTIDLGAQTAAGWKQVKCSFPLEHIQQIWLVGAYADPGGASHSDLVRVEFRSNGNNMQFAQHTISSVDDADAFGPAIYLTIPFSSAPAFQSFPVPYPLLSGEAHHGWMNRCEVRVTNFAGDLITFDRLVLHCAVTMPAKGDRPLAHVPTPFGRRLGAEY